MLRYYDLNDRQHPRATYETRPAAHYLLYADSLTDFTAHLALHNLLPCEWVTNVALKGHRELPPPPSHPPSREHSGPAAPPSAPLEADGKDRDDDEEEEDDDDDDAADDSGGEDDGGDDGASFNNQAVTAWPCPQPSNRHPTMLPVTASAPHAQCSAVHQVDFEAR